eukprot:EG_transcript_17304
MASNGSSGDGSGQVGPGPESSRSTNTRIPHVGGVARQVHREAGAQPLAAQPLQVVRPLAPDAVVGQQQCEALQPGSLAQTGEGLGTITCNCIAGQIELQCLQAAALPQLRQHPRPSAPEAATGEPEVELPQAWGRAEGAENPGAVSSDTAAPHLQLQALKLGGEPQKGQVCAVAHVGQAAWKVKGQAFNALQTAGDPAHYCVISTSTSDLKRQGPQGWGSLLWRRH